MYGVPITLVGNIVDDVALRGSDSGISRVSFRVVQTARRRDRDSGEWVDGDKLFVSVTFFREFAENVAKSMKKGDPVVLTGQIHSRQYTIEEANRISYEIRPDSIGHDLSRGVSKFERRKRGYSGSVEVDADGLPTRQEPGSYVLVGDGADELGDLVGAGVGGSVIGAGDSAPF
jgi:single-strand DNA-binding protein